MAKTGLSDIQREIILALADCGMKPGKAARKSYIDRNTVYYHFERIKAITGKDPTRFYDLIELVEMAKAPKVEPPTPTPICKDCGKAYEGGKYTHFCPDCRKVRHSEAAKSVNLNKIGCEAYAKKRRVINDLRKLHTL